MYRRKLYDDSINELYRGLIFSAVLISVLVGGLYLAGKSKNEPVTYTFICTVKDSTTGELSCKTDKPVK